jgi:hypothetical protein
MTALSRRALIGATASALPALAAAGSTPFPADPVPELVRRSMLAEARVNARWGDEVKVDFEDELHQAWDEAFEQVMSEVATTPAGVLAHLRFLWDIDGPCAIPETDMWHDQLSEPAIRVMFLVMKAVAQMLPADERPSDDDLLTRRDLRAALAAAVEAEGATVAET